MRTDDSDLKCIEAVQRCSVEKGALRNFAKFTKKHLCQSLFLSKAEFREMSKNAFCYRTPLVAASECSNLKSAICLSNFNTKYFEQKMFHIKFGLEKSFPISKKNSSKYTLARNGRK